MNVSLYQAAAALNASARSQDIIASNMAASAIPGFKKQEMSYSAIQAGMLNGSGNSTASSPVSLPKPTVGINFQQGELKNTANPNDIALQGKGFLEIQLPSGALAYTRDGEMQLNSQGQLVTKQGYMVMGESGPIQMDRNSGAPMSINGDGTVSQGALNRGKIKVVDFNKPELLTPISAGIFAMKDPNLVGSPPLDTKVHQGFLENANTAAAIEMTSLISSMRAFEANQRIVQIQDERMGKIISELGTPN